MRWEGDKGPPINLAWGPRRINPALLWQDWQTLFIHSFSHSFIHSRIYKAPLQEIYSESPPAQPRRYRSVLSNLQNALSLLLGRILISKGSPFQVEGPTMENARRCLVAVLARGTNSWPVAEERRARRPGRPSRSVCSFT